MDFVVPADCREKIKENEKGDKFLDLCQGTKNKVMTNESDSNTNCNWHFWNRHKGFLRGLEELEIRMRIYIIVNLGQNTEKSPGDLKTLAVI